MSLAAFFVIGLKEAGPISIRRSSDGDLGSAEYFSSDAPREGAFSLFARRFDQDVLQIDFSAYFMVAAVTFTIDVLERGLIVEGFFAKWSLARKQKELDEKAEQQNATEQMEQGDKPSQGGTEAATPSAVGSVSALEARASLATSSTTSADRSSRRSKASGSRLSTVMGEKLGTAVEVRGVQAARIARDTFTRQIAQPTTAFLDGYAIVGKHYHIQLASRYLHSYLPIAAALLHWCRSAVFVDPVAGTGMQFSCGAGLPLSSVLVAFVVAFSVDMAVVSHQRRLHAQPQDSVFDSLRRLGTPGGSLIWSLPKPCEGAAPLPARGCLRQSMLEVPWVKVDWYRKCCTRRTPTEGANATSSAHVDPSASSKAANDRTFHVSLHDVYLIGAVALISYSLGWLLTIVCYPESGYTDEGTGRCSSYHANYMVCNVQNALPKEARDRLCELWEHASYSGSS
ncbi:unnamed protein product [Amoebophrya sp. A25]|nr:unnamed protein product [Amoebophrya sp. A25]|eukprot:GSA25T00006841001.1